MLLYFILHIFKSILNTLFILLVCFLKKGINICFKIICYKVFYYLKISHINKIWEIHNQ